MYGDWGADIFTFESLNPSGHNSMIMDFNSDELDRIDLAFVDANTNTLANEAFTFVTSFTYTAGELMYDNNLGLVLADTDGDGASNFDIFLNGAPNGVTASSFIL